MNQLPHLNQIKWDLRKGLQDPMTMLSSLKTVRHYAALGFEEQVVKQRFDIPIVQILTSTDGPLKEAALKVLQGLLSNQKTIFPKSCLRCLISIAESCNDPLRLVANEMLCEAAVIDPLKAFENGVIKYLFASLVEGPKELLDGLLLTCLYLLDSSETRKFVRQNVELEMIISFFSDFNINSKNDEQKLIISSRVLLHLMKSWTGMLYLFGSQDTIKSVISSLKVPVKSYREHLIGTFCSIIALPDESDPSNYTKRPNLVFIFHFRAMQVILLLEAGLLDVSLTLR
jgi:rapamycin-insensitive companion of mTOR